MTLNWRDLNKKLPSLSEAEVQHLLLDELNSLHGMHRGTVVVRLHQRFTALRATRERDELLAALRVKVAAPDLTSPAAPLMTELMVVLPLVEMPGELPSSVSVPPERE